ncbi:uncharacterized protein BO97DRAFT_260872 [Aspergillus homomorphus CBS 101889]|uniref:Uncharacterized protein n=1 Tax=Aspergillus homomorphus (strain CBS 101889) TaxID=1450537 RepID=A0A395I666_ASPHC|nr:hypothetical protein BO97DRAFT_260872 [Aspergillus homomorphus CBS 101889]RAL14943.1 hypothetical protein BO97DRAFT_260872 [Aspergillus homomorphus CBS 101889]
MRRPQLPPIRLNIIVFVVQQNAMPLFGEINAGVTFIHHTTALDPSDGYAVDSIPVFLPHSDPFCLNPTQTPMSVMIGVEPPFPSCPSVEGPSMLSLPQGKGSTSSHNRRGKRREAWLVSLGALSHPQRFFLAFVVLN